MHNYILDTKYASENLIRILNKERDFLNEKLFSRKAMIEAEKDLFGSMKDGSFTSEGIMDLYRLNRTSENLSKEVEDILNFIVANMDSLNAIAGAVLQISKQGISFKYNELSKCPVGRMIGRESLKNIIWQSRNQAMHFEEGKSKQSIIDCFKNLEIEFGNSFKLVNKSCAYDVLMILGWGSYNAYEKDMVLLLG